MAAKPLGFELRKLRLAAYERPAPFRQHRFRQVPERDPALQRDPQQRGNRVAIGRKLAQPLDQAPRHREHAGPGMIEVDPLESRGNPRLDRQHQHAGSAFERRFCFSRSRAALPPPPAIRLQR